MKAAESDELDILPRRYTQEAIRTAGMSLVGLGLVFIDKFLVEDNSPLDYLLIATFLFTIVDALHSGFKLFQINNQINSVEQTRRNTPQ